VYFISTLWHGGGDNISDKPRQSATVQYCQPYIRPIENQILAVDPRKLDGIHPRIVEMMGYKHMQPFMGYADGLGPKRAARWTRIRLRSRMALESPSCDEMTS
jgi:ectoine hydroxylase-related dioxygenase (phytanoyl-CoA dioxygenase family)